MNARMSITISAYSDGSWAVALVETAYDDRGVAGAPDVVARRVAAPQDVQDLVLAAAVRIMRQEAQRQREDQVGAGEREDADAQR